MPVTTLEREALALVADLMHPAAAPDRFEGARGIAREAYGDGGLQSNYPRGLSHLADWDVQGRWNQRIVDDTRTALCGARLTKREDVSGWELAQRAKETTVRRRNRSEERRLLNRKLKR